MKSLSDPEHDLTLRIKGLRAKVFGTRPHAPWRTKTVAGRTVIDHDDEANILRALKLVEVTARPDPNVGFVLYERHRSRGYYGDRAVAESILAAVQRTTPLRPGASRFRVVLSDLVCRGAITP